MGVPTGRGLTTTKSGAARATFAANPGLTVSYLIMLRW